MALKITKIKIWSTEIKDHPGAAAEKLRVLANAGADLKFVLARRQPDKPGKGILFLSPVQGKKQERAAKSAQIRPASNLVGLRVEGPNKKGLGYQMTHALAQMHINLRGLVASVLGNKFVLFFAFDTPSQAEQGIKALRKMR
jgi:hypothetical protein